MSSTYSQSSKASASIHSDTTANLPRMCDDPDCTYPFGAACDLCTFDLDVRDQAKRRRYPEDCTQKWVEEVCVNKHITEYAGTPFLGDADEGRLGDGSVISDVVEADEDQDEVEKQVSEGDEMSEPDAELAYEPSSDGYDADIDARSVYTQLSPHIQQSVYPGNSTGAWTPSSPTTSLFPSTAALNLPEQLSPWLTDIFDRTLAGQRENTHFVGDADKSGTRDDCPLCRKPVGPPQLQHLLNCQFAHDEKERMEKFGRDWRV